MSYLDIDRQIEDMTNDLKQKMIAANIIDETGNALNVEKFDSLIDEAISKCYDMLKEMEETRRYDANSNNIIFSRINSFKTMKKNQTFNLYVAPEFDEEKENIENFEKKNDKTGKHVWLNGIKKLFAKTKKIQPNISPDRDL